MADPFNRTNRDLIISPLVRYGIPATYDDRPCADSGGLITYGADRSEEFRQAAGYIDRILKGQKPMDLPIQNPNQIRAGHQSQDRQGAQHHGLAVTAQPRRRGDRIVGSTSGDVMVFGRQQTKRLRTLN
jgi:hypothetical protein